MPRRLTQRDIQARVEYLEALPVMNDFTVEVVGELIMLEDPEALRTTPLPGLDGLMLIDVPTVKKTADEIAIEEHYRQTF